MRSLDEITLAMEQIGRVRREVDELDADDAQLLLDMIEGETGALELVDKLLLAYRKEQSLQAGLKAQIEEFTKRLRDRASASEKRAESIRRLLARISEEINVSPIRATYGTVSRTKGTQRAHVYDVAALPDRFTERRPKQAEITRALKDGEIIPGASLNNAPPSWQIR